MNTPSHEQTNRMLAGETTSLEDLEKVGWRIEGNQGGMFFRHETGVTRPIPFWALQLCQKRERLADEYAKQQMREALGLE